MHTDAYRDYLNRILGARSREQLMAILREAEQDHAQRAALDALRDAAAVQLSRLEGERTTRADDAERAQHDR